MSVEALFPKIESPEFHAKLGVVSTPRGFDAALFNIDEVQDLATAVTQEKNDLLLYERIGTLLADPEDNPNFVHPHDMPIAVYLRILDVLSSNFALVAAESVAERKNFWWTRAMALRILAEPKSRSIAQYYQLAAYELYDVLVERAWTKICVHESFGPNPGESFEKVMTIMSRAGALTKSFGGASAGASWRMKVSA